MEREIERVEDESVERDAELVAVAVATPCDSVSEAVRNSVEEAMVNVIDGVGVAIVVVFDITAVLRVRDSDAVAS